MPRARRQQEHADMHACPPEHTAGLKQERSAKKPAIRSARHAVGLSVPRMRHPQMDSSAERAESQDSSGDHCTGMDEPPEGATSQTSSTFSQGEDSSPAGNKAKHKTKRRKGNSKIPDEKTGRDVFRNDGKKKDEFGQVAPPGKMETKDIGGSERELHSSHSRNASSSRSSDSSQPESNNVLQMADVGQQEDSKLSEGHDKILAAELVGQTNVHSTKNRDDKLEHILDDADQLPGNHASDGSRDLAGSHIDADIPTRELVERTNVASGKIAISESEGKTSYKECVPEEDMVVEECDSSNTTCTEGSNSRTKEMILDINCDKDQDSQCQCGERDDKVSQNLAPSMDEKNIVEETSELKLAVCLETMLPLKTDCLTSTIGDDGCGLTCVCDGSKNSDTGDALVTCNHECSDVVTGDCKGCSDEEVECLEVRLQCGNESEMKESKNDANVNSDCVLAENESVHATSEICENESEMSELGVCDDVDKSGSKMDVQGNIGVHENETYSNVQSGNNVGEDENETSVDNIKSGKDEESETSCKVKLLLDDKVDTGPLAGPAQLQTDTLNKTIKVKDEKRETKLKDMSDDIGTTPDDADDSHQEDSVAMDTEDEEDDSWDKLFDDTGEALDPKLVEEVILFLVMNRK